MNKQKLIELLELTKDNKPLTKIILDHYYEAEQPTKTYETKGVLFDSLRDYLLKENVYMKFMVELERYEKRNDIQERYIIKSIFGTFDFSQTTSGVNFWFEHENKYTYGG